jgi:uncharacterized protein YkwD
VGGFSRASLCVYLSVVVLLAMPAAGFAQAGVGGDCKRPAETRSARVLVAEITCRINEVRAARDLRRLRAHPQLRRGATAYARRLVRERLWTHFGDGTPADRAARSGYLDGTRRWVVGEVLGSMRSWDPAGIVQAFLDSPSHRRVLLRPGYQDIGVGAVEGLPRSDAPGGYTLTVNLGER